MLVVGPLGFTLPWLLWGLLALPVLWLILRAVPPAPVRRRFPGVILLLGLADRDSEAQRTPWWLLALRLCAVAAMILGFAGPVLNPQVRAAGSGPLLVLLDGGWPDAADWQARIDRAGQALAEAARSGRRAALVSLTDLAAGASGFHAASTLSERLPGLAPRPWLPDAARVADWAGTLPQGDFETFWLSGGVDWPGRAGLLARLQGHGPVTVFESPGSVLALAPARFDSGQVLLRLIRSRGEAAETAQVVARGLDPGGLEADLARAALAFAPGQRVAEGKLALPPELQNRIDRFEVEGSASAGATSLADDAIRRRKVALVGPLPGREGLELLSPTHYLAKALQGSADLVSGTLADILAANPDAIILADVARLAPGEAAGLADWVAAGGLLVRFAGPELAAADTALTAEDPLLPVRLRAGGRTVGGAMSWGEPKTLAPFPPESPFAGLAIPGDVTVSAQVLAEPGPDLAARVIAILADGTPLVTRKALGQGQVVLFHSSANAEWTTLPLSGLFVQMLDRLAVSARATRPTATDLAGTTWVPDRVLDGFGRLGPAGNLAGVAGEDLSAAPPGPAMPPGLYRNGDRRLALNVIGPDTLIEPAAWPASVTIEGTAAVAPRSLAGPVLLAALVALVLDALGSMALAGRLGPARLLPLLLAGVLAAPQPGRAQDAADDFAALAASNVTLAHVVTGDARLDDLAQAGLRGLSRVLFRRTAIEPAEPLAVDVERDELAVFPFLYWPVTPTQPLPSAAAYARLNRFLQAGGMILFDTRDGDLPGGSANAAMLQRLAAPLDIPRLERLPADHVLTRAFYLLQDFPGRYDSPDIWVEAAPPGTAQAQGMPFRDLNDGVTPVVIGGNDWASAWAVDASGAFLVPVGRGRAGERQRELAYRFGVNLIMHVLTGNYKSDQVHVPALLERLGK